MIDDLRRKAKKKVLAKKAFYIIAVVFASVSIILYVLSVTLGPPAAFWLKFAIMILGLVLVILYVSLIGIPFTNFLNKEWEEEEIEREMARLYREETLTLPSGEELDEEQLMELKELDRLKRKWQDDSDFV